MFMGTCDGHYRLMVEFPCLHFSLFYNLHRSCSRFSNVFSSRTYLKERITIFDASRRVSNHQKNIQLLRFCLVTISRFNENLNDTNTHRLQWDTFEFSSLSLYTHFVHTTPAIFSFSFVECCKNQIGKMANTEKKSKI